jgi:hypothetical protein
MLAESQPPNARRSLIAPRRFQTLDDRTRGVVKAVLQPSA